MTRNQKVWRVGALVYTTPAVAALFCTLLLGDFSWSMRDRSVGPMSQWYLDQLGASSLLFGLLMSSLPALITMILGPIISVRSDRHRGRMGRRIPYLLITTPIAVVGMIGLGLTPQISAWVHELMPNADARMIALICFGLFWTLFEFATIAGQAVFAGLINDVVPQELLGRFYGLFRAISLIDGMIFGYWIMGLIPVHFTTILLVVAVFYGVSFLWVCLRVKEGSYPPPPELPPSTSLGQSARGAITRYFRECFSSSYYLTIFLMITAAGIMLAPVNTFAIPYSRSVGVGIEQYGQVFALSLGISLLLALPLGWLVDVFHPLRMTMVTLAGYAAICAWGALYATNAAHFLVGWLLHCVLSGCYFTCVASLGQRLFPHQKFAQFASAAGIFTALGNMVVSPMLGLIVDLTGQSYRHTFTAGFILATTATILSFIVYRQFKTFGGPKNYVAPTTDATPSAPMQ